MQTLDFVQGQSFLNQNQVADALAQNQYWMSDQFISPDIVQDLRQYALTLTTQGQLAPARIGRAQQTSHNSSIRSDWIHWIDDWKSAKPLTIYAQALDALKDYLRQELFLPIRRYESHFAQFPLGAHYQKHLDQHKDSPHRLVTCILYLAPWQNQQGGELKLYLRNNNEVVLAPVMGRFVCFICQDLPHEVLVSFYQRYSLTTWFRDDDFIL